jgi:nucleoside-diphosphate-sugar epimerase
MSGCDTVFHCAADTRALVRDTASLFACNVHGLVNAMEAALGADVRQFVANGTIATIGRPRNRPATEEDAFDWNGAPPYVRSRAAGEERLLTCCRSRGPGGISMCVGNAFGPADARHAAGRAAVAGGDGPAAFRAQGGHAVRRHP